MIVYRPKIRVEKDEISSKP